MQPGLGEPQHTHPRGLASAQVRACLENLRSRTKPAMAKRDYLVDAAKQIRMALDREVSEDYEAAFNYYKNGVDLLLNGVQVDPNKERREAVKRKTTQYLKRAEEIFNSHLQGGFGTATSKSGGYSSLRFRPIRILSSPVEDLKMCKVVGVIDKVLTVQSAVTMETFVVKSLPKSSWESRDHQTIIPQGVPFMVQLLRYYVSEDTVYLHLEHVQGGRLFSKLHKSRNERVKEHPECCSPSRGKIKLKNSYTAPTISLDYEDNSRSTKTMTELAEDYEQRSPLLDSSDTDSSTSWAEAQDHMAKFNTHAYSEDTGCLLSGKKDQACHVTVQPSDSWICNTGVEVNTGALSATFSLSPQTLCPNHSETQENLALPPDCCSGPDTRRGLNRALEFSPNDVKSIDSNSEVDVAGKTAANIKDFEKAIPYLSPGNIFAKMGDNTVPQETKHMMDYSNSMTESKIGQTVNQGIVLQSRNNVTVPSKLQLTSHDQSREDMLMKEGYDALAAEGPCKDCGTKQVTARVAILDFNTEQNQGQGEPGLCNSMKGTEGSIKTMKGSEPLLSFGDVPSCACPVKEMVETSSGNAQSQMTALSQNSSAAMAWHEVPPALLLEPHRRTNPQVTNSRSHGQEEELEEGWELLSPLNSGDLPEKRLAESSDWESHLAREKAASLQCRNGPDDRGCSTNSDLHIEVDGWCLLPKFPSRRASEKPRQACWGLPEEQVQVWVAQILLALESLHQQGIVCRDLNPKNILLDSTGNVRLTYFGQWSEVESQISAKAMEHMYCAPEVGGVAAVTEACDWWSLGALLYELLTGMPLRQCHPAGVLPHTQLLIPDHLSTAAASLLTELLQFDAGYRLGSGGGGVSDIKCHPFFSTVPWHKLSA
ncbi:RPKL1 protein, partial [Amia calva]|nr:RPKL1 protein [Amia calva]